LILFFSISQLFAVFCPGDAFILEIIKNGMIY
jgi:hypothetical protein